jgi:hypothetical protein
MTSLTSSFSSQESLSGLLLSSSISLSCCSSGEGLVVSAESQNEFIQENEESGDGCLAHRKVIKIAIFFSLLDQKFSSVKKTLNIRRRRL